MAKSSIMVHLLHSNLLRDFHMTNLAERAEFAKTKFKEMFEGKDTYYPIAGWTVEATGEEAAEVAFEVTNSPFYEEEREMYYGSARSVSVGDIVEVANREEGTKYFLCDSFGWLELDKA